MEDVWQTWFAFRCLIDECLAVITSSPYKTQSSVGVGVILLYTTTACLFEFLGGAVFGLGCCGSSKSSLSVVEFLPDMKIDVTENTKHAMQLQMQDNQSTDNNEVPMDKDDDEK